MVYIEILVKNERALLCAQFLTVSLGIFVHYAQILKPKENNFIL
jgi:hypothetical protein